jgi:hypothetical protein
MSDEIKRKVEKWLCAEMRAAIPGSRAVPSKGDPEETDAPEPPFTFVKVTECDEIALDVYQVTVKVARVSHIDDTTAAAHSAAVRQFRVALRTLIPGKYEPLDLIISGIEFSVKDSSVEVRDAEESAHADVFTLVAGVSG